MTDTVKNLLKRAEETANKCGLYHKHEIILIAIAMNNEAYDTLSSMNADSEYLNDNTDTESELQKMLTEIKMENNFNL